MQQMLDTPGGVRLGEILPDGQPGVAGAVSITSCCSDWRMCRPGDLFVALPGPNRDGHEFAQNAVARGAAAVLAQRPLPVSAPTYIVPDTREAFGLVCQALAGAPSRRMRVVGVAGSAGKTTTCMLAASMLEMTGARVGVMTSMGYTDSVDAAPTAQSAPGPPELARWMARMTANQCSHCVLELSAEAAADRRFAGIGLDAILLAGAGGLPDAARGPRGGRSSGGRRLLDQLKPGGFTVINTDDPQGRRLLPKIDKPSITVALRGAAEVTGQVLERHASEQTFLLTAGEVAAPVRTRIIGQQHVYNCLTAAALGLVFGMDLPTIVRGLEAVEQLPGRLERIECGQPFSVFVDLARTPPRLSAALRAVRNVTRGRLICVFAVDEKGDSQHRCLMGRVAERWSELPILTTQRRLEQPLPILHDALDGCRDPSRIRLMPDRRAAILWAIDQARAGDTVLVTALSPANPFAAQEGQLDDREIIRRRLYQAGAQPTGGCRP